MRNFTVFFLFYSQQQPEWLSGRFILFIYLFILIQQSNWWYLLFFSIIISVKNRSFVASLTIKWCLYLNNNRFFSLWCHINPYQLHICYKLFFYLAYAGLWLYKVSKNLPNLWSTFPDPLHYSEFSCMFRKQN